MSNWGEDDLSNHQLEVDGYGRNMIQTQQVTNFIRFIIFLPIFIDFIHISPHFEIYIDHKSLLLI